MTGGCPIPWPRPSRLYGQRRAAQCRGRQEGARFRGASRSPSQTSPRRGSPGGGRRRRLLRGRAREDLFIGRRLASRWARAPRSRAPDRSAPGKGLASAAAPASSGPGSRGWRGSPQAGRWRPRSAFVPRSDRIGRRRWRTRGATAPTRRAFSRAAVRGRTRGPPPRGAPRLPRRSCPNQAVRVFAPGGRPCCPQSPRALRLPFPVTGRLGRGSSEVVGHSCKSCRDPVPRHPANRRRAPGRRDNAPCWPPAGGPPRYLTVRTLSDVTTSQLVSLPPIDGSRTHTSPST